MKTCSKDRKVARLTKMRIIIFFLFFLLFDTQLTSSHRLYVVWTSRKKSVVAPIAHTCSSRRNFTTAKVCVFEAIFRAPDVRPTVRLSWPERSLQAWPTAGRTSTRRVCVLTPAMISNEFSIICSGLIFFFLENRLNWVITKYYCLF